MIKKSLKSVDFAFCLCYYLICDLKRVQFCILRNIQSFMKTGGNANVNLYG